MFDIDKLKQRLQDPLPGYDAQSRMMPEGRHVVENYDELIPASVLLLLIKNKEQWTFPLIERSQDEYAHSGQIALPGGRLNPHETPVQAAIRETSEEIGLIVSPENILGQLSLLPIPVSKHLVYPFVAFYDDTPNYVIDQKEVAEVFEINIHELQNKKTIQTTSMIFGSKAVNIPYYDFQGRMVWGATAMILSEFSDIISHL